MKLIAISFLILLCSIISVQATSVTYQPLIGNFEIVEFDDFGMVTNLKNANLTIRCVEGSGSASVKLTKEGDASISINSPTLGIPSLSAGESYTAVVRISNLQNLESQDFTITATVSNSIGSVTDNAVSSGTALKYTSQPTYLNVETLYKGQPINGLEITINYFDYSQTKETSTFHGQGTAQFDLETSADIEDVEVFFEGNAVYYPVSTDIDVEGGSEETVTFNLDKIGESNEEQGGYWEMVAVILGMFAMITILGVVYIRRKK